ncbi:glycoside hydrolase family 66 protein [Leuconostoc citreum]|uniref:glycoside hydrolase family 66 protein n=1 Tax=Leuconostoc citreum TaxID=33964 RepID=UPI0032E056A2
MVDIDKIMTTDADGTKRQIMPQTHVSAILGLDKQISEQVGGNTFNLTLPAGDPGKDGADGKSAYQLAVQSGFQGSLSDWLNSLKGKPGEAGGEDSSVKQISAGQYKNIGDVPNGTYYLAIGGNDLPSDMPVNSVGYGILVSQIASEYNGRQEYTDLDNKTTTRIKASGVWQPWRTAIAQRLDNARKINGTTFDNTQDVTVYRVNDSEVILNTSFEKFETDKAHYHPWELVEFLFKPKANAGNLAITYYKRNELVATQHIAYDSQTVQWHWRLPGDDIEAYIVKVVNTVKGQSETFYHAINVSWDQKDRPLMGFLSKFGDYNLENVNNIMTYLKRLHINYIQYYDWFDRHDVPIKTNDDGFVSQFWGDFVNRPTRFDLIHKYIELGNKYGILSMAYGLINGASHNNETDGLSKDMFMFDDNSQDLGHVTNTNLTPWAKYVLYQMNFMVDSWQDYFTKETAKIYRFLPFDGWHIDTLGDPGSKYDSTGKNITTDSWKLAYPFFINKAISNSNGKRAGLNAVAEYGQKEIASSNADYIYTEVWDNRKTYNDMMNMIIEMRNMSDKELIVAGYMHHHWSDNNANNTNLVFNDPAVILTDLVIMASGATHLEMGEHMLTTEYFPNNKLSMSDALKDYLVKIYDLQVAFKRLFKIKNKAKVDMVSSTHAIFNNFMQKGNLSIISKEDDWYRVDSIINMIGLNGDTWRDDGKDRNYPTFQDNVMVGYPNHGDYKHFYVVEPKNPVPTEVFPDSNGNFTIHHIEYFTLVYATKF